MPAATLQTLEHALETLPDAPTHEVRLRALELMRQAVGGGFAAHVLTHTDPDSEPVASAPCCTGDDDMVAAWNRMSGLSESALRLPWTPRTPPRDQVNRFRTLDECNIVDMQRRPVWADFYVPHEATDQVRALLYDGDEMLGWLGVVRRRGDPAFVRAEVDGLQRLTQRFATLLSTLASRERELLDGSGRHVVLDDRGRVLHASREALALVDLAGLRELLADMVRRGEAGRGVAPRLRMTSFEVRMVRLDATPQAAWLATLRPLSPTLRAPTSRLTPRQREVAEYAAAGATVAEIAATLSLSPNTVKWHLRCVYDELFVANRVELAEALRRLTDRSP